MELEHITKDGWLHMYKHLKATRRAESEQERELWNLLDHAHNLFVTRERINLTEHELEDLMNGGELPINWNTCSFTLFKAEEEWDEDEEE